MNRLHKQIFFAAVAAAVLVAFASAPIAQEAKKDAGDKQHAHQIAQAAPAMKHQQAIKKLEAASGPEFDKLFMTQMVKDHEDALKRVQETANNAKDAELKADAEKTAPVIQKHLDEAKRIAASLK